MNFTPKADLLLVNVLLPFLFLLLGNAAVLMGATVIWRQVRTQIAETDVLLFLLIRLALISLIVLTSGLTGTLTCFKLTCIALLSIVVFMLCGARLPVKSPSFRRIPILLRILVVTIALRLALQIWFFAPFVGDVQSYHLPKVAEWIRAGGFTREHGIDSHSSLPAGFELIETWWVVFLHHDALIEVAGVEFLLIAGAAVATLARYVGFGRENRLLAALLYTLVPGFSLQTTSCMNDCAVAAVYLGTAAIITSGLSPSFVIFSMGIGIGIKPTFLYLTPGLILLLCFVRSFPGQVRPNPRIMAWLIVAGAILGSFWYLRSSLFFGNPFHPVGLSGLVEPGGRRIQAGPSLVSLYQNAITLFTARLTDPLPYSALMDRIAGWGIVAATVGFVGALLLLRSSSPYRKLILSFLLSLAFSLASVVPDRWNSRFFLFFPAVLCISTNWMTKNSWLKALLGVLVAIQFVVSSIPAEISEHSLTRLASRSLKDRSIAPDSMMDLQVEKIGYLADSYGFAYMLYRPDYSREVIYLRSKTSDELIATMEKTHTYVLYASPAGPGSTVATILGECIGNGKLRAGHDGLYYLDK